MARVLVLSAARASRGRCFFPLSMLPTPQMPEACFVTQRRRPIGRRFRAAAQTSQSMRRAWQAGKRSWEACQLRMVLPWMWLKKVDGWREESLRLPSHAWKPSSEMGHAAGAECECCIQKTLARLSISTLLRAHQSSFTVGSLSWWPGTCLVIHETGLATIMVRSALSRSK